MDIPEHLWQYPSAETIASLARRFGFPNMPGMQDWVWQVADSSRIDEFLAAYSGGELSDDERFTLMETIIQSFDGLDERLAVHARWPRVLGWLDQSIDVHIYSVWYWSCDEDPIADGFRVTPDIRKIQARHRSRFVEPRMLPI